MRADPERMDNLSKTNFKDIYPLIASHIIKKCGITKGIGIDIGSGPGALAITLAKITDLKIYSLDISAEMRLIAKENIENEGLNHKIFPLIGDVHKLPFNDDFADLIVSRGSIFFWKDKKTCFKEIYRVLKPSGYAYIGGGFGSAELRNKIKQSLKHRKKSSDHAKVPKINVSELRNDLNSAAIKNYRVINDDSGLWVIIKN